MDTKIASLMAVVNLPGYAVICDYFEEKVQRLEKEVLQTDPTDKDRIITAQNIAVAARWILRETLKQIEDDIKRSTAAQAEPMSEKELQELYIRSLQ